MKVYVIHSVWDACFKVYIVNHRPNGETEQVFPIGDNQYRMEVYQPGVMREDKPSLILDAQTMQSFVQATRDIIPASEATQEHLRDAMATRDRLLTLVEKYPT